MLVIILVSGEGGRVTGSGRVQRRFLLLLQDFMSYKNIKQEKDNCLIQSLDSSFFKSWKQIMKKLSFSKENLRILVEVIL